ncbi:hypothetical protein [Asaia platycodi]|uniref:hypothetical protein n=1 Tax=Asaia platycodi TaxID=610243 RepID=UPI0004705766|nr:hypothetical protein [Asaia platycodi]
MLDLSRKDWEARLRAGRSLLPDLEPVNPELAARAVRNFNRLRIPDVPAIAAYGALALLNIRAALGRMGNA